MTVAQKWVAGAVVAALALLAGSWFLLVSPKRDDATSLQAQADAQLQDNQSLETQIDVLKAQKKNLPEAQADLAELQTHMPTSEQMPAFIRSLADLADKDGMFVKQLTPAKAKVMSTMGVEGLSPSTTTPSSTTPSTTTPSTTTPSTTTPSTTPSTAPPATGVPANPSTSGQMYYLDSVLTADGGYFEVERYINSLENMQRYVLVPQMNLVECTSDECKGPITATVTLRVYLMTEPETIPNTTNGMPNTGETTTGTTGSTGTTGTTGTTTGTTAQPAA